MLELIQPFLLSFLIGLFIGIERERSHARSQKKAIGMRTFILFSLLGTIAAKIDAFSLTLTLSLFVFLAILLSYLRATQQEHDPSTTGITTEMAAGMVFMLGYLTLQDSLLALCLGMVVLLILYGRRSLHRFAKEKITAKEIEAAITIVIIFLSIISFLPNKTIDPWELFNPQSFGTILLVLAALQFGGYLGIRLFGERFGMMLIGFFGGLISSTAVFASLSHAKRHEKQSNYPAVIAGVFATIATLLGFLVVILISAPELLAAILWPILAAILFGAVSTWFFIKNNGQENIKLTYPNPIDILAIIKLGVLITGILLLVGITKHTLGQHALPWTVFFTGLFEIHGMAYAIALLYQDRSVSMMQGTQLLGLAVLASFLSKFALLWLIAHNRFAVILSLFLTGMILFAGLAYYLTLINPLLWG